MILMEIQNERLVHAFQILSEGQDYHDTLASAMVLLAYALDAGERVSPTKPRSVSSKILSDTLRSKYEVSAREIIESDMRIEG